MSNANLSTSPRAVLTKARRRHQVIAPNDGSMWLVIEAGEQRAAIRLLAFPFCPSLCSADTARPGR